MSLGLIAVVASVALIASMPTGRAGASANASSYPREKTLITGGTQWGVIQGFNPFGQNYAVGTVGLCNETLLRYNPLTNKYIPWLASGFKWTNGNRALRITIRGGIKWSNGGAFTANDVKWNLNLGRLTAASWHDLYTKISTLTVSRNVLTLTFRGKPDYVPWMELLWNQPMVNPTQAAGITSNAAFVSYNPSDPVGTGPYRLQQAGYVPSEKVAWEKKVDANGKTTWWACATAHIAPCPKPQYIIDLVGTSNLELPEMILLHGLEDLNNSYQPGIAEALWVGSGIHTYTPKPPYHLSADTAWLIPNTTRAPMNSAAFRKAMARAINVDRIVSRDYGNAVRKANPTGLLPTWRRYFSTPIEKAQIAKWGGKSCTGRAAKQAACRKAEVARILRAAHFKKVGKWWKTSTGRTIKLRLIVPRGWADWETAADMISVDLRAAGINVTASAPVDFFALRSSGDFDLIIGNTPKISDSPWTYYQYMFAQPVRTSQTDANFGRYGAATGSRADRANAARGWALARQLGKTPVSDIASANAKIAKIQAITLRQLPMIPLWHGGVWAQWTSAYWKNWPGSGAKQGHYLPCTWRGCLNMTGIDMIDHLVSR